MGLQLIKRSFKRLKGVNNRFRKQIAKLFGNEPVMRADIKDYGFNDSHPGHQALHVGKRVAERRLLR